ncbi:ribonuclease HII [Candidatus Saccharibacteria bacterium]|nr:ribonuclease HII [Candidatus Saccharibacteria bacterium]
MVGVDEVGRGCLAGPLLIVAARQSVSLPGGITDSKVLTREQREALFEPLVNSCVFGEGWVKSIEIDQRGLSSAMKLGVARALKQLGVDYGDEIIMDGPINYLSSSYKRVRCIIDADADFPIVSAASIYAKVRRDRYMIELARRHPRYGFDSHVGYATPEHLAALDKFGALKRIHRQFFEPIYRLNQEELWLQLL